MTRHLDQQHQQPHPGGRNAYQCDICRTVQFSIADIRKHMKELHPQQRSMFCGKRNCFQYLANDEQLKSHWANDHCQITYQCLKCFKRFENEHFIEKHIRSAHMSGDSVKMLKTAEHPENQPNLVEHK